jgi:hypothetical protein
MRVPHLRHPIVLVHGVMGYGRLHVGSVLLSYWANIPDVLTAAGNRVLVPRPNRPPASPPAPPT